MKECDAFIREWIQNRALEEIVRCVECGRSRPGAKMQKVFKDRPGKGICKRCWLFGAW